MESIKIGYQHDIIKKYKLIKKGKYDDLFVLEGFWPYEKILQTDLQIETIIYSPTDILSNQTHMFFQLFERSNNAYEVSHKTMGRINSKEDTSGILLICKRKTRHKRFDKVVILDGLENPGNIGTIFRSADGAGIDGIFIVNSKTKINQYKVVKASMGGYFNIPWLEFKSLESLQTYLNQHRYEILLADPNGKADLQNIKEFNKSALIIGNERYGLSKEWFHRKHTALTIPMRGCCDSLNAGVAASILIYHMI